MKLLGLFLLLASCEIQLELGRVAATGNATDAPVDAGTGGGLRDAGSSDVGFVDAGFTDAGFFDGGQADGGGPAVEMRTLTVNPTPIVTCADSLGGREAEFTGIRAADLGFEGGSLLYRMSSTSVVLEGDLLTPVFERSRLVLEDGLFPDQPAGTFVLAVPIQGPAGPLESTVNVAAIYVDTLQTPPAGEAGFQYETPSADGACFVSFPFSLQPE